MWYGPYRGKDGRQRMYLYLGGRVVTSISYARHLLQKKVGRDLTNDEEANLINEDPTDDRIENLEIKPRVQHQIEHNRVYWEGMSFICEECEKEFFIPAKKLARTFKNRERGHRGPFCTRSCVARFAARFV